MAVKVTKGQISDGTISENTYIEDYYLCGKFHGFMKKYTIFWLCRYTNTVHVWLFHFLNPTYIKLHTSIKLLLVFIFHISVFFLSHKNLICWCMSTDGHIITLYLSGKYVQQILYILTFGMKATKFTKNEKQWKRF